MLSILLPIYNFNVEALVTELVNQCRKENIAFEILCFDDYSKKKYREENRKISEKFGVSYIELSENYGRSKIRNSLAKNSRFRYLLFIDCDSKVIKADYIARYLNVLNPEIVINGGRVYKSKPPRSLKKRLHWKYGIQRESLSVVKRNHKGSAGFHTNNFVIPKSLFEKLAFKQELSGYGYEDLVFASEIEKNNIDIINIDNAVEHLGLEQIDVFLMKTEKALHNLALLDAKSLVDQVKLVKTFKKLDRLAALPLLDKAYKLLENKVMRNLYSNDPSLYLFDFYRLVKFNKIKKSEIV